MLMLLAVPDTPAERDRFTQLWQLYAGLMLRIAQQILSSDADAEDAVQQAFLYLLNHMQKISDPACLKTRSYIALITEHAAIDLLRARYRRGETGVDEAVNGIPVEEETESPLADALLRLSARYREALLLRYRHGCSIRELAELYGIQYGAAQRMLHRAKQALRQELEKGEQGE